MSNETEPRIIVPTDVSEQEARQVVYPESQKSKKGRGTMAGVILGGLGVIGVGGGVFMATQGDKAPELSPTPTAEAPVTPGGTPVATEPTVEPSPTDLPSSSETLPGVEQSALSAELDTNSLAEKSGDLLMVDWRFASATEADAETLKDGWYSWDGSIDSYLDSVAEENAKHYEDLLLPVDWESKPSAVDIRSKAKDSNVRMLGTTLQRTSGETTKPLMDLDISYSGVEEFSSAESIPTTDRSEIPDELTGMLDRGEARIISYIATPEWENNDEADATPYRFVTVFDITDGTARLIHQHDSPA